MNASTGQGALLCPGLVGLPQLAVRSRCSFSLGWWAVQSGEGTVHHRFWQGELAELVKAPSCYDGWPAGHRGSSPRLSAMGNKLVWFLGWLVGTLVYLALHGLTGLP